LEVPHPLELPRVRGPVVPLVRTRHPVVRELVPDRIPGLPAVVGALDLLTEPPAALRGVDPIGIRRRALQVIHLPAGEMRTRHVPALPLAVRRQDEGSLARSDQDPDSAHVPHLALGTERSVYSGEYTPRPGGRCEIGRVEPRMDETRRRDSM